MLPAGGGPAAQFDPAIGKLALESARALLAHVNPETGLALRDDPVLAWVTLAGEVSLFNLIERPDALPLPYAKELQALAEKAQGGPGRRFWESIESAHSKQMADALRKDHVRVPIAGVSHWRREPEFNAAQAGKGLDLIDDRLFWTPLELGVSRETLAALERAGGRPGGSRRDQTPARSSLRARTLVQPNPGGVVVSPRGGRPAPGRLHRRWRRLGCRGSPRNFPLPAHLGRGAGRHRRRRRHLPDRRGRQRQSSHLWALAARGVAFPAWLSDTARNRPPSRRRRGPRGRKDEVPVGIGWDHARGRLLLDTPYTQGVAGWIGREPASFAHLDFTTENPFAVLIATSISDEPIATSKRLLVSAIARVEPTGFRWVDSWKREVADPGRPPFLQEPVIGEGRLAAQRKSAGLRPRQHGSAHRRGEARDTSRPRRRLALIDGKTAAFHWELIAE